MTDQPAADPRVRQIGDPPEIASEDLLTGRREVVIRHGSERYRLKLTSSNKLILIK